MNRSKFNSLPLATSFVFAVCVVLSACASEAGCPTQIAFEDVSVNETHRQHHEAIESYIRDKKGWTQADYKIDYRERKEDILVFWVIHRSDHEGRCRVGENGKILISVGGGESVAIHFDPGKKKVVLELAFQ